MTEQNNSLICSRCGMVIGEITKIEGRDFLRVNGVLVSYLRGVCTCGTPIYWALSDRMLAELIKHMKSKNYQV